MKRRKRRIEDDKVDQPPMTPMIDVVFQLLIYFMLTMHFKEVEGKLLSQLPKREGLDRKPNFDIPLEVRMILCAGGDIANHRNNKGKHEKGADKPNEICFAYAEREEMGEVYMTEVHPGKGAHNKGVYRAIAVRTAEIYHAMPRPEKSGQRIMIVLDADSEVPYEHIIGVVNACKEVGINEVEFVGNARFAQFYGSGEKSQFKRYGK